MPPSSHPGVALVRHWHRVGSRREGGEAERRTGSEGTEAPPRLACAASPSATLFSRRPATLLLRPCALPAKKQQPLISMRLEHDLQGIHCCEMPHGWLASAPLLVLPGETAAGTALRDNLGLAKRAHGSPHAFLEVAEQCLKPLALQCPTTAHPNESSGLKCSPS